MFTTDIKFNALLSAIYRNRILQSQLKILAKKLLSIIWTHTVDFCTPGHTYAKSSYKHYYSTCTITCWSLHTDSVQLLSPPGVY